MLMALQAEFFAFTGGAFRFSKRHLLLLRAIFMSFMADFP